MKIIFHLIRGKILRMHHSSAIIGVNDVLITYLENLSLTETQRSRLKFILYISSMNLHDIKLKSIPRIFPSEQYDCILDGDAEAFLILEKS